MGRLAAIAKLGVNRLEERLQEQPPLALVPRPSSRPSPSSNPETPRASRPQTSPSPAMMTYGRNGNSPRRVNTAIKQKSLW